MTMTAADPLVGTCLGAYAVEGVLGEGGMGRVYRGTDPRTQRPVAIKVIGEEHARDEGLVRRFYAEADAATRIRHPGIVEVYELTYLTAGRPAIVMEMLSGCSLRARIEQSAMPIPELVDVLRQILDAVAAAHAAGIVHRDLKPDNVMLSYDGRAKVLDFGIAKLSSFDSSAAPRTRTGMMLGTPDYMAPEQIMGGVVDGRTDIYAAGAMLFEMLTGQRPFTHDTQFLVLQGHISMPVPSVRDSRPMLSPALDAVVQRAMAKAPADRFPSASAMSDALESALRSPTNTDHGLRTSATPTPYAPVPVALTPAPSSGRARATVAIAAALVASLAIGVLAVVRVRHHSSPSTATSSPAVTPSGPGHPIVNARSTSAPVAPPPPTNPDYRVHPAPPSPAAFDVSAFSVEAERQAKELMPDAQLTLVDANGIRSDGTVDLTLKQGTVAFMYWTPTMKKRPPTLAANQDYRAECVIMIDITATQVQAIRTSNLCDKQTPVMPRCSFKQLWDRARAKGADPKYAAHIQLLFGAWDVRIDGAPDHDQFTFANDCSRQPI
ncbi:hypothetical protein BH11MYX2_BH11MYX2_16420 [soil metagenome]